MKDMSNKILLRLKYVWFRYFFHKYISYWWFFSIHKNKPYYFSRPFLNKHIVEHPFASETCPNYRIGLLPGGKDISPPGGIHVANGQRICDREGIWTPDCVGLNFHAHPFVEFSRYFGRRATTTGFKGLGGWSVVIVPFSGEGLLWIFRLIESR